MRDHDLQIPHGFCLIQNPVGILSLDLLRAAVLPIPLDLIGGKLLLVLKLLLPILPVPVEILVLRHDLDLRLQLVQFRFPRPVALLPAVIRVVHRVRFHTRAIGPDRGVLAAALRPHGPHGFLREVILRVRENAVRMDIDTECARLRFEEQIVREVADREPSLRPLRIHGIRFFRR